MPRLREPTLLWNPARLQQAPLLRELGMLRPAPQPRPALLQQALLQMRQVQLQQVQVQPVLLQLRQVLLLLRQVLLLLRQVLLQRVRVLQQRPLVQPRMPAWVCWLPPSALARRG